MSRLNELMQELCPDGVEYKKLVDVTNVLYGYPCDASKFNDNHVGIPLIRIRDVLLGRTDTYTTEKILDAYIVCSGDLLIGMDGNFHVGNWKSEPGYLCQRVCKVSSKNEQLLLNRFLSNYLPPVLKEIENSKPSGTVKHLLSKDINSIKIPVPPLEVQHEIVRILDNYTAQIEQLKSELNAELDARKKQYEYYRDELLSFDSDMKMKKLGDVCVLKAGKSISSFEISDTQTVTHSVPCYGGNGLRGYVKEANQQGNKSIIGRQGALCGNVCYATGSYYATEHAVVVTDKGYFDNRFLYHMLINKNLNQYKTAGAQPGLSVAKLETILVPVPNIEVQKRIGSVLDNFDAICSELNIVLSTEIEARQKQYEYYRDKLLTFEEIKIHANH